MVKGGAYKKIISQAWQTTRTHKELWFFAILAGLANTGVVFNSVVKTFLRIRPADQVNLETFKYVVDLAPWLLLYIKNLLTLDTVRIVATVLVILLILSVATLVIVMSQHILLSGIFRSTRKKNQLKLRGLFRELRHLHFWRILSVDLLIYLLSSILLSFSSLALAGLLTDNLGIDLFVFTGIYTLLLPLLFTLNLLGMFVLINIVRLDKGLIRAFTRAWNLLSGHWLAALEVALLLFVINFLASILLLTALVIYAIPAIVFYIAAFHSGSLLLVAIVSVFGALGALAIVLVFAGAITTFNYSIWIELMERFERYGATPVIDKLVARFKRMF
ncbi:MAG: hypothetical protein Q8P30_04615 [Candidatus Uhrbacteria bacterium]|nr:hypothetical protein [Candidatus Uhrbacteria bacterium]